MSSHRRVRNDHLVLIAVISTLVIAISNYGYFDITKVAYGQSDPNQMNSNTASSVNIQDIPLKKVRVGDIDIAYKTFGKGEPFLLIGGIGDKMDSWEPSILRNLSTNHTVIVFDNRGVGNTTTGTKPFSIQQLANDTTGLLEALKIQKADILGYSLGSLVAQQLIVTHPEKVNRLLLVAASCGGKESIPLGPRLVQLASEMTYKSTHNVPLTRQDVIMLMNLSQGSAWMKSHPNLLQGVPEHLNFSELSGGGLPPNTYKQQAGIARAWMSTNWSGICDKLTRISSPTLIITGTDDNNVPPANSLIIAAKIPDAWLVHIKD